MENRTPRTILLVPERWAHVDALRTKHKMNSTSAAVAMIVAEWVAMFGPDGKPVEPKGTP